MTESERERFANAIGALAEVLQESLSDRRAEGYFLALKDLSIEVVEQACAEAMRSWRAGGGRTNFPKPADLRDLVLGDPAQAATLAWERAVNALEAVGVYENVNFPDDPAIHRTIHMLGGWAQWGSAVSRMDDRAFGFARAEWERVYQALRARHSAGPPPRLIGLIEGENVAKGILSWPGGFQYLGRPPVEIGPTGQRALPEGVPARPALPPAEHGPAPEPDEVRAPRQEPAP